MVNHHSGNGQPVVGVEENPRGQGVVWTEWDTGGALCTGHNPDKVDTAGTLEDIRGVLYQFCTVLLSSELLFSELFHTVFIIKRNLQNCCLPFKPTNNIEQQCGPAGADQFNPNAVQ